MNQAVTLSGLTGEVSFPPADPGSITAAVNAQAYTVSTNNLPGYTLILTASGTGLVSASSGTIPNTNLTVTETGANPGSQTFASGSGASLTLATTAGPSSDNYTENWALALPVDVAAATYSEEFVYLALAN